MPLCGEGNVGEPPAPFHPGFGVPLLYRSLICTVQYSAVLTVLLGSSADGGIHMTS